MNEECDDGTRNGRQDSNCTVTCQIGVIAGCGNGTVETGEECDPGGNCIVQGKVVSACLLKKDSLSCVSKGGVCSGVDSQTCTDRCQRKQGVCGDGIVQNALGEECDDGERRNAAGSNCDTRCRFVKIDSCGDGVMNPLTEQCDAGAENGNGPEFTCRSNCILPWCGDGILDYNEECDDGNKINGDRCSSVCMIENPAAPSLTADLTTYDAVLSSNANPASNGQSVTLTYTMQLGNPALRDATGEVRFTDERTVPPTVLGTVSLENNTASLTIDSLTPGIHTILGTYLGDATHGTVSSNFVHQRIINGNVPSPARAQTGPGLVIFLASGAAAGYGLMRRWRKNLR
ncbi:MAG: Ig-like domain repeat protein [Candidatus Peribacteraceae bacterium]|nr:Ig-like domain repeat protein [Candidatus Peribacteraceae bacterium]